MHLNDAHKRTVTLLTSRAFYRAPQQSYEGAVQKLRLLSKHGIAPMMVLPAETLIELGRIPHSTENRTVDALDVLQRDGASPSGPPNARFIFFSHRWLRPDWCETLGASLPYGSPERQRAVANGMYVGDVDDQLHSKALALGTYVRWLRDVATQSLRTYRYYFWIDFCSANQDNPGPQIAALPAYIANCHSFLTYLNPEYHDRAWCRLELLLHASFCRWAMVREELSPGLTMRDFPTEPREMPWGSARGWVTSTLRDPREGRLGNPDDRAIIETLTQISEDCALTRLLDVSFFAMLGAALASSVVAALAGALDCVNVLAVVRGAPRRHRGTWGGLVSRVIFVLSTLRMHFARWWHGVRVGGSGAKVYTYAHRLGGSMQPFMAAMNMRRRR